ncbi:MAG TPA: acetyl-CoA carboxylase biotin carboxyl carrier protein subunit [Pseudomonadota bacterium]|jgi:acetyl-CoA carboxylase biotin carboxyl carrier protein|nr:acetyl-CoA carboxylase biotin carboxyl carrier protein subunit [Pseudomonadota bacterium]
MNKRKHPVKAHITGNVWKITTTIGAQVSEGDTLVIMESMKMEMPVEAELTGTVVEIITKEGLPAKEGEVLLFIEE